MAGSEVVNIDKSNVTDNDPNPDTINVTVVSSKTGDTSGISGSASFVKNGLTWYSSSYVVTETEPYTYNVAIKFNTNTTAQILNSKTVFTVNVIHHYGSDTATFTYTNDTEPPVFKLIAPNKTVNKYVTFTSCSISDLQTAQSNVYLYFYTTGHVYDKISGIKSAYVRGYYNGIQLFNTTLQTRNYVEQGISDGSLYNILYASPNFVLNTNSNKALFGDVTQGVITLKYYITDNANNTTDPDTDPECCVDVPFVINTVYKYVKPVDYNIVNSVKIFEFTYENTVDFKAYPIIMGYWKNNNSNSTTITAEFYDNSDNLLNTVTNTISGVKSTYQPFITKLTNSVTDTGTIKVKVTLGTTGDLFKHTRYCVTDPNVNNTSMIDTYTKLVSKYCMPKIFGNNDIGYDYNNLRYYYTYWLPTLDAYSAKDVYVRDSDGLWKPKKDMYYFTTKDTPKKIKKIFVKQNGEWHTYLDEEYNNSIMTSYAYIYAPVSPNSNKYSYYTNSNSMINCTLNHKSTRTVTIDSVVYYFINTEYELCENYRHLYDEKNYTIGDYINVIGTEGSVKYIEL